MTLTDLLFDAFSVRAFSSLWFYVLQISLYAFVFAYPLGISPWITQPKDQEGAALYLSVVRNRQMMARTQRLGWIAVGGLAFFAVTLALLALFYRIEWAQGLALLAFPVWAIIALQMRAARRHDLVQSPQAASAFIAKLQSPAVIIGFSAFALTQVIAAAKNLSFLFGV